MSLVIDIKNMFRPDLVNQRIMRMKPLKTPVMDTLYPEDKRSVSTTPLIGVHEITEYVQTAPVVKRGAAPHPVVTDQEDLDWREPCPVKVELTVNGVDLSNFRLWGEMTKEQWASAKIENIRNITRRSTELLGVMSLTGKIAYPMKSDDGTWGTYSVDYTSPLIVTPPKKWDASGATISDVFDTLENMEEALNDEGWGTNLEVWAGINAYRYIRRHLDTATPADKIECRKLKGGILIGADFMVKKMNHKNRVPDPQTVTLMPTVPPDEVVMFDKDANSHLFYGSVDDLAAFDQPDQGATPLFIAVEEKSGNLVIRSESKPLPVPDIKAVCWAKVVGS